MKAVRFHEYGGPLVHEEAPQPVPGAGQVLVKVAATAYNPVDTMLRAGYLQQGLPMSLPHTPGIDVSGTVVGRDDPVIAFLPLTADGAAAEYVAVDSSVLAPAPATIPLADAAALPSSSLTAWQGLFEHLDLKKGQRILINGGGGAVGGYAIQFAKQFGAYVIATASARSKAAVEAAGADEIIDYTTGPLRTEPVDAVFNLAVPDPAEAAALVALVKDGGAAVSATVPLPADAARTIKTVQMNVRSDAAQLKTIAEQVDAGTLRVDIGTRIPLAELAEAEKAATTHGKVIIQVG